MDTTLNFISTLISNGFSKTDNPINDYSKNADLYYKKINKGEYIVFNHYNKNLKEHLQGFDCWISVYKNETNIGKIKVTDYTEIRLSFQISRDWNLIAQHL